MKKKKSDIENETVFIYQKEGTTNDIIISIKEDTKTIDMEINNSDKVENSKLLSKNFKIGENSIYTANLFRDEMDNYLKKKIYYKDKQEVFDEVSLFNEKNFEIKKIFKNKTLRNQFKNKFIKYFYNKFVDMYNISSKSRNESRDKLFEDIKKLLKYITYITKNYNNPTFQFQKNELKKMLFLDNNYNFFIAIDKDLNKIVLNQSFLNSKLEYLKFRNTGGKETFSLDDFIKKIESIVIKMNKILEQTPKSRRGSAAPPLPPRTRKSLTNTGGFSNGKHKKNKNMSTSKRKEKGVKNTHKKQKKRKHSNKPKKNTKKKPNKYRKKTNKSNKNNKNK